jgi:predicted enzyme related to lactoylglutathione lyase
MPAPDPPENSIGFSSLLLFMPNIAFFDIPADNVGRARHFYTSLFGWKINIGKTTPDQEKIAAMQYHGVLTGETKVGTMNMGGLYKRQMNETIKNYVEVGDIDAVLAKVESLGGRIVRPKEMIPGVGLVAMIQDTEGNGIGVWKPLV